MAGIEDVNAAWNSFCDELKSLGPQLQRLEHAGTGDEAAESLQFATRVLRGALDYRLDGFDPLQPRLLWWDRVTAGASPYAPNIDNTYLAAKIDGRETYRLSIPVATIDEMIVSVHAGDPADGTHEKWGDLCLRDLEVVDGRMDLVLSGDAHDGNWLEIPPRAQWLFVRLYYFDWERGAPPAASLVCTSARGRSTGKVSADALVAGFADAARWMRMSIVTGQQFKDRFLSRAAGPNVFSEPEREAAGPPIIRYGGTEFDLAPDEALVMEFEPPDGPYWIVQWHRLPWGDSADFLNHITSLNNRQARVDSDGRVRIVFAHADPGVQNWISTETRRNGIIIYRWLWSTDAPVPRGRVVPFAGVRGVLPGDTPGFSERARGDQLAVRREHLLRRY
ncbi:MAG: DUF1214 domain-containing protein [Gammaproteobacteria bacterium]